MYHQSAGLNDSGANFKADYQHIKTREMYSSTVGISDIVRHIRLFGGHPTLIFARTGGMNGKNKKIIQVRHPGEIGEPTQEQSNTHQPLSLLSSAQSVYY